MLNKPYEFIEHTADIMIRVRGKGLKELFSNAAKAMFSIIAVKQAAVKPAKKFKIIQSANSLDELFINWLNELLSLSSAKEVIFFGFKIIKIDEFNLQALALARSSKYFEVDREIKAATYHQLKIKKEKPGWLAEVIFDV